MPAIGIPVDGRKIRRLRQSKTMTQAQFAREAGISHDTVNRIERGVGGTHGKTLRKISDALGVDPAELLEERER